MKNDFLWVEKYRPKSIEDCILPQNIKDTFQQFVDKGEIPNLLLAGPAGCGKTTIARALCEQLGSDYIIINGSDKDDFWTRTESSEEFCFDRITFFRCTAQGHHYRRS